MRAMTNLFCYDKGSDYPVKLAVQRSIFGSEKMQETIMHAYLTARNSLV